MLGIFGVKLRLLVYRMQLVVDDVVVVVVVGIRLSCQIMESAMGLVINFGWSSVWRG